MAFYGAHLAKSDDNYRKDSEGHREARHPGVVWLQH
jgi:hypothetical protein